MGRALSVDLRERVIAAIDGGLSCRAARAVTLVQDWSKTALISSFRVPLRLRSARLRIRAPPR